jgi:hypothetical protein
MICIIFVMTVSLANWQWDKRIVKKIVMSKTLGGCNPYRVCCLIYLLRRLLMEISYPIGLNLCHSLISEKFQVEF